MARKVIVAMVMFVLLGVAFAEAASTTPKVANAPSPSEGNIGNEGEEGVSAGGFAEAGPVGGPVSEGTFQGTNTDSAELAPPPKNGASNLEVSSFVGVIVTGFSLFYF
ncbi:unnamed protein product [Amaranthus hypochondriacus]